MFWKHLFNFLYYLSWLNSTHKPSSQALPTLVFLSIKYLDNFTNYINNCKSEKFPASSYLSPHWSVSAPLCSPCPGVGCYGATLIWLNCDLCIQFKTWHPYNGGPGPNDQQLWILHSSAQPRHPDTVSGLTHSTSLLLKKIRKKERKQPGNKFCH